VAQSTLHRMMWPMLAVIAIAALTLAAGMHNSDSRQAAGKGLQTVRFNMSWLPQGSMAGIFVAIDKGYYAQEGLEVEPMRGFGGIRTVNELDQGMFELAYADPLSVALNRANGGKTKMIGGINMKFPAGACYIKERHKITRPADLAGLTFGAGQSSSVQTLLPVWLKANGVNPDRVRRIQLDPAIVVASLVEGKIDAAECWLGNSMALFEKSAAIAGVTVGRIAYADFGLDVYGSGFVTRDDYLGSHADTVRKFLAASYRGYADAARDPTEALAIIMRQHPLLDEAVTGKQIRETVALMAAEGGSHRLDHDKVQRIVTYLKSAGQLKGFDATDSLFTNNFIPIRPTS
jgi:NitT/TauT family transport system substrate-binding protein